MKYMCEGCKATYDTALEAFACEEQLPKVLENAPPVGSIVAATYPAYGWWKGDRSWCVMKHYEGTRFMSGYYPIWVHVGTFDHEHKRRYLLWTPSNALGNEDMRWTSVHHVPMHYEREATPVELERATMALSALKSPLSIPLL